MWYAIAFLAVLLIASVFLTPKPKIENARASQLSDFTFPRADEGDPVPIISGTIKMLSPNTVWTGNFRTQAITKKVKTGMFSSKRQTTGYRYYVGMDLAMCLGPGVVLKKIWFGKYVAWEGSISTETRFYIDKGGLYGGDDRGGGVSGYVTFYPGSFTQTQDPYLVTSVNADVPSYNGICHMVFEDFYLGNSPSIQPIYFELQRLTNALAIPDGKNVMPNGLDLNLMEVFYDIVVGKWGRLGLDPAQVDTPSLLAAASTLFDEENGASVELAKSNTGSDFINEIIRQANGLSYVDPTTGKIRFRLIRKDYDIATLPVLDPSNVKSVSDLSKKLWEETINQVRVTYPSRANSYKDANAVEQDFANINFQQRVRNSNVSFPMCYEPELAQKLAAVQRAHLSVPWFSMKVVGNRQLMALEPGDPFVLNWPRYNIRLMVLRAGAIEAGELENGEVSFTALQDEFGGDIPAFGAGGPTSWIPTDPNSHKIVTEAMIETPYYLAAYAFDTFDVTKTRYLGLARKPAIAAYQYKSIWTLDDFVTTFDGFSETPYQGAAVVKTTYPASAGFDTGTDPVGIIIESWDGGIGLIAATEDEVREGSNMILVGGELMGFETVTQNMDGSYTLGNLHRGLLDTQPQEHLAGVVVFFVDMSLVCDDDFSPTLTVKSKQLDQASANTWPEATADIMVLVLNQRPQRPLPPSYITFDGQRSSPAVVVGTDTLVEWRPRNRLEQPIRLIDDPADTPEAGTTYSFRYRLNGGAWSTVTPATASYTIPGAFLTALGTLDVEVTAVRGGLDSWTATLASASVENAQFDTDGAGSLWDVDAAGSLWKLN